MNEEKRMGNYLDNLARESYGMTRTEAHTKGICLKCKEPAEAKCHTEAGAREWEISGFCEECFDNLMSETEEE